MKETDIHQLRPYLEATFDKVTRASVAVSGSLSRGDFRVSANGEVLSDLDLMPIIACRENLVWVRTQLAPLLQKVADTLRLTCTAAITLSENFLRVRQAAYVTSMTSEPFVCDDLGLQAHLRRTLDQSLGSVLPWRIQPITYYLAKSGYMEREDNLAKAILAFQQLISDTALPPSQFMDFSNVPHRRDAIRERSDLEALSEVCADALVQLIKEHEIQLLPSSCEYLKRRKAMDVRPEVFESVRDRAFLENQGLSFQESLMVAHPSPPKERT
ncbi:hypothetical protein [Streptomyces sp. NPDC001127]|uniref:hypothetical protein n=1 Tax=Streptomyces sp. NPDC001127 TaxID=3154377 RepID=UPI003331C33D